MDFSNVRPLGYEDFERVLRIARRSSPGPDSIPFCPWAIAGDSGVGALSLVTQELFTGTPP
jgi:hypothetical protein